MAHEHLRSQPVAVALAAEVADAALAPVEALIPRGAADYLRERVDDEAALRAHAERLVVSELLGLDDDPFADPEDHLMRAQRRQALTDALDSLEPDERRFVELYYEEDRRTEDIGRELAWGAERTVQRRHLDILERLHARLQQCARRQQRE